MSAPLSECTVEEQRAVVRFLWSQGIHEAHVTDDFLLNMETMLCQSEASTNEWRSFRMITRVLAITELGVRRHRPELKTSIASTL